MTLLPTILFIWWKESAMKKRMCTGTIKYHWSQLVNMIRLSCRPGLAFPANQDCCFR